MSPEPARRDSETLDTTMRHATASLAITLATLLATPAAAGNRDNDTDGDFDWTVGASISGMVKTANMPTPVWYESDTFSGLASEERMGRYALEFSLHDVHQITLRYTAGTHADSTGAPPGTFYFSHNEFTRLYGLVHRGKYGHVSAKFGPSFGKGRVEEAFGTQPQEFPGPHEAPTAGVALGASAYAVPFKYVGLGLEIPVVAQPKTSAGPSCRVSKSASCFEPGETRLHHHSPPPPPVGFPHPLSP